MRVSIDWKSFGLMCGCVLSLVACGQPNAKLQSEPPSVTSITPSTGKSGTLVAIKGYPFSPNAQAVVGGVPCPPVKVFPDQMFCTIGSSMSSSAVDVVVTNGDSQSGSLKSGFTYDIFAKVSTTSSLNPFNPEISFLTPNSGPTQGGTRVSITGSWFADTSAVTIGGKPCKDIQATSFKLSCTTTANIEGIAPVVVTTPTGTSTLAVGYLYLN